MQSRPKPSIQQPSSCLAPAPWMQTAWLWQWQHACSRRSAPNCAAYMARSESLVLACHLDKVTTASAHLHCYEQKLGLSFASAVASIVSSHLAPALRPVLPVCLAAVHQQDQAQGTNCPAAACAHSSTADSNTHGCQAACCAHAGDDLQAHAAHYAAVQGTLHHSHLLPSHRCRLVR